MLWPPGWVFCPICGCGVSPYLPASGPGLEWLCLCVSVSSKNANYFTSFYLIRTAPPPPPPMALVSLQTPKSLPWFIRSHTIWSPHSLSGLISLPLSLPHLASATLPLPCSLDKFLPQGLCTCCSSFLGHSSQHILSLSSFSSPLRGHLP